MIFTQALNWKRNVSQTPNFVVKDEATGKAVQVKEVNAEKTLTLFQKPFEYLFNAEYIPIAVKPELRQEAVAQGLIDGNISDYNQQHSTTSRTQGPKTPISKKL